MTGTKSRVLIVDDEPQILRFLRTTLGANGFDIVEAATGAEALRRAAADAPDVIVLDLGLPDMDGKAVIKKLREYSQTPIVVLSARAREAEKIEALDAGADDYVNKPFGIGELMARLRAALRHRLKQEGSAPSSNSANSPSISSSAPSNADRRNPPDAEGIRPVARARSKRRQGRNPAPASRGRLGPAHVEDASYLRVYIGQLRRKIEAEGETPFIENEPGVGYRLRDE